MRCNSFAARRPKACERGAASGIEKRGRFHRLAELRYRIGESQRGSIHIDQITDALDRDIGCRMQTRVDWVEGVVALAREHRCQAIDQNPLHRRQDRLQTIHDIAVAPAPDHQTVASLLAGHAAPGADIDVVKARCSHVPGAANVVTAVRIAAVDHRAANGRVRHQFRGCLIHGTSWHHQPDCTRPCHLPNPLRGRPPPSAPSACSLAPSAGYRW